MGFDIPEAPRQGDGWNDLAAVLAGAVVGPRDAAEEYGFSSSDDLVDFVEENLVYNDSDRELLQDVQREVNWGKCGQCEEEIAEYMAQGAMRGEVDINPRYEVRYGVTEEEADHMPDADVRKEGWLTVYCEEHDEAWFSYESSWYE